MTIQEKPS